MMFRLLDRSDFSLLRKWLASPHVNRWWHETLDLAGVEAKFGPRIEGAEPTHVFMIEVSGRPVGWIQWYWWSDYPAHAAQLGAEPFSAGIDLAIGEEAMTGLGLGPAAIIQFLKEIVHAESVYCDPEEVNVRSLRAFEKAGFTAMHSVQLEGENFRRRVVRFTR